MKISKLFHWLYAALMFLPLMFFLPSVLYYSLNKYATNTETTTINYKYKSNEVNSLDDVIVGNIYDFNISGSADEFCNDLADIQFELLYIYNYDFTKYQIELDENYILSSVESSNVDVLWKIKSSWYSYIDLYFSSDGYLISNTFNMPLDTETFNLHAIVKVLDKTGLISSLFISQTDYNEIESVSVNTNDTITDKVNRAFEGIFDLPLFSWTKTTFVSNAFIYIGGLFGIASTNPIVYLFGYWLSISLCWLVFDLMIYVPNLAHRWLDKGAIE